MQYLCDGILKAELIKTSVSWYDSLDLFYTSRLIIVPWLPQFGFEQGCVTLLASVSSISPHKHLIQSMKMLNMVGMLCN